MACPPSDNITIARIPPLETQPDDVDGSAVDMIGEVVFLDVAERGFKEGYTDEVFDICF